MGWLALSVPLQWEVRLSDSDRTDPSALASVPRHTGSILLCEGSFGGDYIPDWDVCIIKTSTEKATKKLHLTNKVYKTK